MIARVYPQQLHVALSLTPSKGESFHAFGLLYVWVFHQSEEAGLDVEIFNLIAGSMLLDPGRFLQLCSAFPAECFAYALWYVSEDKEGLFRFYRITE